MTFLDNPTRADGQVRALMENMASAIRAKNVNAVMSCYAPDVVGFDLLPPLQSRGADAVRERLAEWFGGFQSGLDFEMRNLHITTSSDVAFCHSLNGVRGKTRDGTEIDMWWRATNCMRRIEGTWLVTHCHASEPFDMESGQALTTLKPA